MYPWIVFPGEMPRVLSALFSSLIVLLVAMPANAQDTSRYSIIPQPAHLEVRSGAFKMNAETAIMVLDMSNAEAVEVAELFAVPLRLATGWALPVQDADADNLVHFHLRPDADMPAEGYSLEVGMNGVVVTAATPAGLFYGSQTLRQLLPVAADRGGKAPDAPAVSWEIPAVLIEDAPRFGYRGMHLDVGRHFFSKDYVIKFLDMMARYKLNRFHWHLTEDQGWRIEIKQYPKLTEIGAYRDGTLEGHYVNQPHVFDGKRYGGFYTQEEIREVVAYAAARHIMVIPEIELPGHALAALASYPELACTEGPFEVGQLWGVYDDIFCPKEETFTFLENVLSEVIDLFPGPYVHVGGDEAPKGVWDESPITKEVMRREGLADSHELQSYFIRRIERFLNAKGKKLIGWDEIVEGGLSPTATMMFWRDWHQEGLELAASQGNDIIMTPNRTLYFDHLQGNPATEPLSIGGMSTLEKVYGYEPIPASFDAEQEKLILGAQANIWTEYLPTEQKLEYMVFPRFFALSEVVWSEKEARDWFSFRGRLPAHLDRLRVLGITYRPLD